jgi:hypothetical protein
MANVALVDLYVPGRRIRAEVGIGNFGRLSDALNNSPSAYLSGVTQMSADILPSRLSPWSESQRDMVVPLAAVQMVVPIQEPSAAPNQPALMRDRMTVVTEIDVDVWRLTGTLYLIDRVRWSDYLASVRNRFVPLSHVRIQLAGTTDVFVSDLVLVNGVCITALQTDPS